MSMRRSEMIGVLIVVFIIVMITTFSYMANTMYKAPVTDKGLTSPESTALVKITCSDGSCSEFSAEIADTREEHATGLMNRTAMAADSGMIFAFPDNEVRNFWMENTLIPLDIIFIDTEGKIIDIHENATPLSRDRIQSSGPCKYVLEVNGGICQSRNIREGDRVSVNK